MNYKHYTVQSSDDMIYTYQTFGGTGDINIGYYDVTGNDVDSAIRFQNVTVNKNQTIVSAILSFKISSRFGSGSIRSICYGFDEDDTANFSGGFPSGRPRTTAFDTDTSTESVGEFVDYDVTSIVQEIVNRANWSNGNAMGFIILENGSDTDDTNTMGADYTDGKFVSGLLQIKITADPDVTPASKSVAAPSFPAASNYGIKISEPGVDVGTANEENLYFTTRKKVPKIITEDEIDLEPATHGFEVTVGTVTHNLGYLPSWLVYGNKDGYRFKMPRWLGTVDDPVAGGPQGYVTDFSDRLEILNAIGGTITYYYYVFIDELP